MVLVLQDLLVQPATLVILVLQVVLLGRLDILDIQVQLELLDRRRQHHAPRPLRPPPLTNPPPSLPSPGREIGAVHGDDRAAAAADGGHHRRVAGLGLPVRQVWVELQSITGGRLEAALPQI